MLKTKMILADAIWHTFPLFTNCRTIPLKSIDVLINVLRQLDIFQHKNFLMIPNSCNSLSKYMLTIYYALVCIEIETIKFFLAMIKCWSLPFKTGYVRDDLKLRNCPLEKVTQHHVFTQFQMSIENWSSASSCLSLLLASTFLSSLATSFLAKSEVTPENSEVNYAPLQGPVPHKPPGIAGRFLGGVLARGEFLMLIKNALSYTILVPPGVVPKIVPPGVVE